MTGVMQTLLSYSKVAPSSLLTGLTAYWKFDESSGNAADSSGNGKTATNTSVTYAAEKINNGAVFNGSSSIFTTTIVPNGTGGTFACWFKTSSAGAMSMFEHNAPGGTGWDRRLYINAGKVTFDMSNNALATSVSVASVSTYNDGAFHFAVGKWDSTNGVSVRVDNGTAVTSATYIAPASTNDVLYIGKNNNGGSPVWFWNGALDEGGIWSRAVTSTEETTLYNAGAGKQYPF